MTEDAVLITGVNGLLGRAVQDALERAGRQTIGLDRTPSDRPQNRLCDLTDVHRLYAATRDCDISAVVQCGGLSGPMLSRDNPPALINTNVGGMLNVLELARALAIPKFIHCSSAGVYGTTRDNDVTEEHPTVPSDMYGASKLCGEVLADSYARLFGLQVVNLRFCWIYGPRRTTPCVIRKMLQHALQGTECRIPFGKGFHRQFVYIDDAVDAIIAALGPTAPRSSTYNISSGEYHTLDAVAAMLREAFPSVRITLGDGPDPEDDIQQRFNIERAVRDLNYKPKITLPIGIRLYAEWLAQTAQQTQVA